MAFNCDDLNHCRPGQAQCPIDGLTRCPGLPVGPGLPATPASYGGFNHFALGGIDVCTDCITHGRNQKRTRVRTRATAAANSGPRAELCKRCIREEMELYWQRFSNLQPAGAAAAASLQWVTAWPSGQAPANFQNLCICEDRAIMSYADTHCHACRDRAFNAFSRGEHAFNEHYLRERTKAVITGKKQCSGPNGNGGTRPHRVRPADINARMARGVGRMCPCGDEPVLQRPGTEFIDVCLACMGVRVIPWRIPAKYLQANMPPRRNTRSAQTVSRTRGPFGAQRRWQWRVNIELGFRSGPTGDGFINGQ
jgi:hypothetical protein